MTSKQDGRSFSTFLEGLSSESKAAQAAQAAPEESRIFRPLEVLAESGPLSLTELQEKAGLEFSAFAGILDALTKPGLVEVSGSPGRETVKITPRGEAFLEASHSKS
jgi:predicted transcriptional regulator